MSEFETFRREQGLHVWCSSRLVVNPARLFRFVELPVLLRGSVFEVRSGFSFLFPPPGGPGFIFPLRRCEEASLRKPLGDFADSANCLRECFTSPSMPPARRFVFFRLLFLLF